jgi:hypothetical protein
VDASNESVTGAARAQWLSDLNKAIDEAQWLAWRIGVVEGRNAQALELYVRLELVRGEVEAMRGRDVRNIGHPPSSAFPSPDLLNTLGKLAAAGERLEE